MILAAASATAHADGRIRTVGAGARTIGCTSSWSLGCEGISIPRLGANVVEVGWFGRTGAGPLAMIHLASRPEGGLVRSQIIAGAGYRWTRGPGWLQAGPGIAIQRLDIRNARSTGLLDEDAALTAMAGGGVWLQRTLAVSLDVSRTIDDPGLYQVLASLAATSF